MDWTHLVDTLEKIHDDEPQRAADLLEANLGLVTNAAEAERFTGLANHVFGDLLNKWGSAATLNRRALDRISDRASARSVLENLSASYFMAGHFADGLVTELEAVHYAGQDALACAVTIRLRVALSLLERGERTSSVALFAAAIRIARGLIDKTRCDRTIAVIANNVASALLELTDRTHAEDEALEHGALVARDFWLKAGDWVNDERADYLLCLAYNALRRHDLAYEIAKRGLATIAANAPQEVDRAFLLLEIAFASRHLGRTEDAAEAARLARELGTKLEGPHQKRWLAEASVKLD